MPSYYIPRFIKGQKILGSSVLSSDDDTDNNVPNKSGSTKADAEDEGATITNDNDDIESEYGSPDGKVFKYEKDIGKGAADWVRQFKSADGERRAVLNPRDVVDLKQVERKRNFFNQTYPHVHSSLYLLKKDPGSSKVTDYRLVLPCIPGTTYHHYVNAHGKASNIIEQCDFFLSAIDALKPIHEKGLVYIDLHSANIMFDALTRKSYLIDGGYTVESGRNIPSICVYNSSDELKVKLRDHPWFALECWSPKGQATAIADMSMDIYSLAITMRNRLFDLNLDSNLLALLRRCRSQDPQNRPKLDMLEGEIKLMKANSIYRGYTIYRKSMGRISFDLLHNVLEHAATLFVVNKKMREFMKARGQKMEYAFYSFSEPVQMVFMELTGCVLFTALKRDNNFLSRISGNFELILEGDSLKIFPIRGRNYQMKEGGEKVGQEFIRDLDRQRHFRVDFKACEASLLSALEAEPDYIPFAQQLCEEGLLDVDLWPLRVADEAVSLCSL